MAINLLNPNRGAMIYFGGAYDLEKKEMIGNLVYCNSNYYDSKHYGWNAWNTDHWYAHNSLIASDAEGAYFKSNGISISSSYIHKNKIMVAGISPFSQKSTPKLSTGNKLQVNIYSNAAYNLTVDFYTSNCVNVFDANRNKDFQYWDTLTISKSTYPNLKVTPVKTVEKRTFVLLYVAIKANPGSEYFSIGGIQVFGDGGPEVPWTPMFCLDSSKMLYLKDNSWKEL